MTISEQVVKAMPDRIYAVKRTEGSNCVVSFDTPSLDYNVEYIRADLVPFLPVQGAVKKLEWNEYNDEQGIPDCWDAEASSFGVFYSIEIQHDGYRVVFDHEAVGAVGVFDTLEAAKAAAQADYSARILSALEPSAARELALEEAHADDVAVDRFAVAMKEKLAKKRAEGRGGWENKDECSAEYLSYLLIQHIWKGDPVDIANLAMMLQQRGERVVVDSETSSIIPDHADAGHTQARDVLARFRDYVIEGITAGTMMRGGEHHNPIWQDVASALHADAGKVDGDGWSMSPPKFHRYPYFVENISGKWCLCKHHGNGASHTISVHETAREARDAAPASEGAE